MKKRQKKFYRIERFIIVFFVFLILSILPPLCCIPAEKFIWWTFLFPLFFITAFVLYYRYLKSIGLGGDELEPNIYKLSPIGYETIIKAVNSCLETEMKTLSEDENMAGAYSITQPRGLILRLLLMKIEPFDRETFKSAKERFNRKINKAEECEEIVSGDEAKRMVRVNFIVIESLSRFAQELVNKNAAYLMGRVEGIINIVYCMRNSELYIPAEFGDGTGKHKKVHKVILKIFKDYLIEEE